MARTGRLRIPAHPGLAFGFLPVAWRTIQHYGVEMGGLRYDGPALTRYRSPFTGAHAGKWPVRFDPGDVSKAYFQDPADNTWHELAWEHAGSTVGPFSAEALAYARRLALAEGRHVDERRALAELLDRWDAGLVRHPVERRMAQEHRVIQQRIHPRPLHRQPQHLRRQQGLPQRRPIAYGAEDDGLDPFQHKGSRPSSRQQ